jgi:hypothetical protein
MKPILTEQVQELNGMIGTVIDFEVSVYLPAKTPHEGGLIGRKALPAKSASALESAKRFARLQFLQRASFTVCCSSWTT